MRVKAVAAENIIGSTTDWHLFKFAQQTSLVQYIVRYHHD
jgi:hypothetical protein